MGTWVHPPNPLFVGAVTGLGYRQSSPPRIPRSLKQALQGSDSGAWLAAIKKEAEAFRAKGVFELVPRPPHPTKVLPNLGVFSISGSGKFKYRLVARGDKQQHGVHYDETTSPTVRPETVRTFFSWIAERDGEMLQADVSTAYLNAPLEEEVFMEQPEAFDFGQKGHVWRLKKAVYGLKQAGRAWYQTIRAQLEGLGWKVAGSDPCLFIKDTPVGRLLLVLYVDDFLLGGPRGSGEALETELDRIDAIFPITRIPIGSKPFLGMEIRRDRARGTLAISQIKFTEALLEQFGMGDSKPRAIPADPTLKDLQKLTEEEEQLDSKQYPYSSLVGGLLWLATRSRPEIMHVVSILGRFMAAPGQRHWDAGMTLLRYLRGTSSYGLVFRKASGAKEIWGSATTNAPTLHAYADSDFAGCKDSRRSTAGFVFINSGAAISWYSKLQPDTAWSTAEAEYHAAGEVVKEAKWLKHLAIDMGTDSGRPISIMGDNQAALKILNNDTASRRTKYFDVCYHASRQEVIRGVVKFSYVSTEDMVADIFTKPLERIKVEKFRAAMGVFPCA